MSNIFLNATVSLSTVTANSLAAGQSSFPVAASGVRCYREPQAAGDVVMKWGVELSRPHLFVFDGLAQKANLVEEGRIIEGQVHYRIKGVRVFDAGVLDHIEVIADKEQF